MSQQGLESQVRLLKSRCTESAWKFLRSVEDSDYFAELVHALIGTKGPLLESDIEQTLRLIQVQHPKR
jgi:hypothetical protein